jgi:hypothetical protein
VVYIERSSMTWKIAESRRDPFHLASCHDFGVHSRCLEWIGDTLVHPTITKHLEVD